MLDQDSASELLFTNSDKAKPKKSVYEREGAEGLTVAIETERDGKPAKLTLRFVKNDAK